MSKHKEMLKRVVVIALLLSTISAVPSVIPLPTYVQQSIEPDVSNWPQEHSNWCGPATLQAAVDWVWWKYNSSHRMNSQQTYWDYMKNNTCYDVGGGRDAALPGNVGDGNTDVRKLNIAYDFGVDPHAMVWTMWKYTPGSFNYHYWIYYNSVDEATRWLLYTVEKYKESVFAAVLERFPIECTQVLR